MVQSGHGFIGATLGNFSVLYLESWQIVRLPISVGK